MNLIINIDEDVYKEIMAHDRERREGGKSAYYFEGLIQNGTPIPDNATVGEVFCMLACKEPICETASYFTIDKNLWNAPYQKGGKE